MLAFAFETDGKPLSGAQHQALFAETVVDYDQNIAVKSQLYPSVLEALTTFEDSGWRLAVCTNKPIAQATKLLGAFGIRERFDAITGSDSFPFRKPDPRHLIETIKTAGGHPDKAIMVGDSETHIKTARAAKCLSAGRRVARALRVTGSIVTPKCSLIFFRIVMPVS